MTHRTSLYVIRDALTNDYWGHNPGRWKMTNAWGPTPKLYPSERNAKNAVSTHRGDNDRVNYGKWRNDPLKKSKTRWKGRHPEVLKASLMIYTPDRVYKGIKN